MLRYGYFDSDIIGVDDEGMPIFDRAETSELFALLFANLISDGVLALPANCFQVVASGNGLNVMVQPGFGMVKGHFCYNDEPLYLQLEAAPQSYNRIDRVVMRCNYLQRMVEIVVKTGVEAATPQAPELIRPAAGDYFELCLANIRLTARQTMITQSSITDTRPDSSVCGYITQLIDHLDTAVFMQQFYTFYQEFVDKSDATFEEFERLTREKYETFYNDVTAYINTLKQSSTDAYNSLMASMQAYYNTLIENGDQLYDQFQTEITTYITQLEEQGNTDLAAITRQLIDFRNTNEAEFLAWFNTIRGQLDDDAAGHLQNELNAANATIEDLWSMLLSGMVRVKAFTDQGDFLTDNLGNALLIGWPICKCNNN